MFVAVSRRARLRWTGRGLVVLAALSGRPATAVEPDVAEQEVSALRRVTFDEALALAPRTPGARAPARALSARQDGDAQIGGTAQALTLILNPGYRFRPEAERGLEGQVGLAQSWNLADLGGARREAAAAERGVLSVEARAAALASRLEAARLWIELSALEQLERLVQRQLELARQTEELMARAAQAGVRTAMDAAQARSFRVEVSGQLQDVHGATYQARLQLGTAMGSGADQLVRTEGPLPAPTLPEEAELRRYVARARALPREAALRLSAIAARARASEESAALGPLLTVGGQLQREPPTAYTVLGTMSLMLSPFDRGARGRSLQQGQAELLEGQSAQAELAAQANLQGALHEVRHTGRRMILVESEWLPAAEDLVNRLERAVRAGEATAYELLDARRRLVEVQALAVRARGDEAWARVRLWLLVAEIERAGAER